MRESPDCHWTEEQSYHPRTVDRPMPGHVKIMRRLSSSGAGLLAIILVLAVGARRAESGALWGKVTEDSTGSPIAGRVVEIEGTDLGDATTEDGMYRIANPPPGIWSVSASASGYFMKTEHSVQIDSGTTRHDFALKSLGSYWLSHPELPRCITLHDDSLLNALSRMHFDSVPRSPTMKGSPRWRSPLASGQCRAPTGVQRLSARDLNIRAEAD